MDWIWMLTSRIGWKNVLLISVLWRKSLCRKKKRRKRKKKKKWKEK